VTGAHYFVLESVARGARRADRAFAGGCRHCGLERRFPARPRAAASSRGAAARLSHASSVPVLREPGPLDHDLLLDALCCVGCGSFAALDQLVSEYDDRPWASRETARALVSLGHLDVELDGRLRPRGWSISPPQLVSSPAGAFLAGWRSPGLLFELGRVAHRLGGRVEWAEQTGGPSRVGLLAIDDDDLEHVTAGLRAGAGLLVGVARDAPARLACLLPGLATLRDHLPVLPGLPSRASLERLEVESLRWLPAAAAAMPGAYRTVTQPVPVQVLSVRVLGSGGVLGGR
jgi:hypothetical protein